MRTYSNYKQKTYKVKKICLVIIKIILEIFSLNKLLFVKYFSASGNNELTQRTNDNWRSLLVVHQVIYFEKHIIGKTLHLTTYVQSKNRSRRVTVIIGRQAQGGSPHCTHVAGWWEHRRCAMLGCRMTTERRSDRQLAGGGCASRPSGWIVLGVQYFIYYYV